MRKTDKMIQETLEMAEKMLQLADRGDSVREDTGCGVLYGVVRDTAYKIRRLAAQELEYHQKRL